MKKFYYLLAGMFIILVTIIACEEASIEVEELETLQKEDVLLEKGDEKAPKVTICHYDNDLEEYYSITISANGLSGHDGHEIDELPETDEFGEYIPLADFDGDGILDCADCYPDDATMGKKMTWYQDADGDGYGNPDVYIKTCDLRDGYVADNTDCDDTTAAILGEYIFEWNGPDGYKHYVNIDYYNPVDGSFTGTGYFIFISHSSTWAIGNEPLTVYGTYNKILKIFTGKLDYDNSGSASFNGTATSCEGLTGNATVTIYTYIDADGDGFSIDEGDCDDNDELINPAAIEICGDEIDNNCDGDIDENAYSPEGVYTIYRTNGAVLNITIHADGTITGSGYTSNGITDPQTYTGTATVYPDHTALLVVPQQPQGGTHNIDAIVSECDGITGFTGFTNDYSFTPPTP